jgi:hypothetical protein
MDDEKRLNHNKKQIEYYHKHKKQLLYYYMNTDKIKEYMKDYRKRRLIHSLPKQYIKINKNEFKIEKGNFIVYFD